MLISFLRGNGGFGLHQETANATTLVFWFCFFFFIVTLREHTALEKQSNASLRRIYHPFK